MKLKQLESIVLECLKEKPITRADDFMLVGAVWKKQGLNLKLPLCEVLYYHAEKGLASFESITRCRRKLAEKYPEFVANKIKVTQELFMFAEQQKKEVTTITTT